jgi:hypothetical protein
VVCEIGDADGIHARRPAIGLDLHPRPVNKALVDLKRLHLQLRSTHQLLPRRVGVKVTWPARPLRSSPITGPSALLRAGPPLCLAVLHPSRFLPPGLSLSRPGSTALTVGFEAYRFSCSMPAPATSSRHLYTGHHQGSMQAAPWLRTRPRRALVPGLGTDPGFDAIVKAFDASSVVHSRSSSRRSPDPLIAGLLHSRFPPRLLTDMTLRRFGLSACTANPEGQPPSLAQHG